MKLKLLLTIIYVFFGSGGVIHVSSQGLMSDMLGFAALNTPNNINPAQGTNAVDFPPLDPLEPPFPPDNGHQSGIGPAVDPFPPTVGSPSNEHTPVSNKPVDKPTDPSTPTKTGLPTETIPSNTGTAAEQNLGDPLGPVGSDPSGNDPFGNDPFANDPFANDPFANDPFANDPFANDPFAMDPGASGGDVPVVQQDSPFFQFIPSNLKHNSQTSGSEADLGPGLPIQTNTIAGQGLPSDSFMSNVKQVDTSLPKDSGHPIDALTPVDSGIQQGPIQLGAGLPTDPMPIEQFSPNDGTSGSEVPTITNDSPFFRFLPSMPTGDKFINLNDGTENTFQPTDNWMGVPLGVAKLEPNGLDPWDPFLPEAPMTDVNLDPAASSQNVDNTQNQGTPIFPDLIPVDLNPLGPSEPIVSGTGSVVGDHQVVSLDTNGGKNVIPLGPADQNVVPIFPVDQNVNNLGPVVPNINALGPVDHNVKPQVPNVQVKPLKPVDHIGIPLGPINQNVVTHGQVDLSQGPHTPVDKIKVDQSVLPLGPVDIVPAKPKIDPNVIPLGPIFGTPVILNSGADNTNQGQGYNGRESAQTNSQITEKAAPTIKKIPSSWMQLYTNDRQRPNKNTSVQTEKAAESVQVSPTDNLLAQASLNTYSKNRGLSRRLRQERRRARKLRQLEQQKQKQLQRQQKHQEQINKPRKQKRGKRKGRNKTGPQGAKIAKMVIPGQNEPFIGKNQRGRGRRMVEPCTAERRRLGLCAQDQLPPDSTAHSNTNTQDGVLLVVGDPNTLLANEVTQAEPRTIVHPNDYVGRQPMADAGQLLDTSQGRHATSIDGIDLGGLPLLESVHGQAASLIEDQMGAPLGDVLINPNEHGGQQLIGIQTVDPNDVGPVRKFKRGGRRQQGNKFNRNGNKRAKVKRKNKRNNKNAPKNVVNKGQMGNRVNRVNRRKQNQRNRIGARRRGPIMRVPNMQDVGVNVLPKDNPSAKQGAQETWNPMTGLQFGQLNPIDLSHETQLSLDPLGSGDPLIPSDIAFSKSSIQSKQPTNAIQHDAAFHSETSTKLDAHIPNIEHSSNVLDPSVQDNPQPIMDTRNIPKKRKTKSRGNQRVVAPLKDINVAGDNSTLFDSPIDVIGKTNERINNKQGVNKKGRRNRNKVKARNRTKSKKDPIMREPRRFRPVEIPSVVKQEEKPTTPDTSNMIKIAGLGFLDLGI